MTSMRVFFETYGCQMNKAESEAMLIGLSSEGWEPCLSPEEADLVVINTCSVRETAEDRIKGRLGYYRHLKEKRRFTLALVGCMAQRLQERIRADFPEVDIVAGTFRKQDLAGVRPGNPGGDPAREHMAASGYLSPGVYVEEAGYRFAEMHSAEGFKAFVPVMHGCSNFCAYCVVPYVRGPEVSRDPDSILGEIEALEGRGVREITLLGQNVNSYRWEKGGPAVDFPTLMRMIGERISSIGWVRFLTSHPRDLSDGILRVMAENPRFCRHIHLPVQSGSTRILASMNRGYTREHYLSLVNSIRASLTEASLTTDILIGFPGESESDFQDTLDLMERVGFDDAFMYYYNPREGTPAFTMADALPKEEKLSRLARVIEVQKGITLRRMAERVGKEVDVLVEGVSKKDEGELLGRTEWDGMVVFPGSRDLIGGFTRVHLLQAAGSTYRARAV